MIPRIATVVTGAWWEPAFVSWARRTAAARVMARCLHPAEVDRVATAVDWLAVGSSCPWLTGEIVGRWRRSGLRVVGVAEEGDRGAARLARVGCDVVVADHPEALAAELAGGTGGGPSDRLTWAVTGPRGAPGRTEIALALATVLAEHGPAVLVEADLEAPSLGLRLGLPPEAGPPLPRLRYGVEVVCPSPATVPSDIDRAVAGLAGHVVVDAGPSPAAVRRWSPDRLLVVVAPTPSSVVRAAAVIARLAELRPLVVANRSGPTEARLVANTLEREVWAVAEADPIEWGSPASSAICRTLAEAIRRSVGPIDSCPGT